jgi:hypothetical protein
VIRSREQAQNYLHQTGYRPTKLQFSLTQRLGAKLFKANIRFDDHTSGNRLAGRLPVVSVRSVIDYLKSRDQILLEKVIALPADQQALAAPARPLAMVTRHER